MNLQNGYKVIYENRTFTADVLTRHLKATKTVPASTTDSNLTYKDASGSEITAATLATYKLVYEVESNLYGSTNGKVNKNASGEITDTRINVYCGNDLLIGTAPVVVQSAAPASTNNEEEGEE